MANEWAHFDHKAGAPLAFWAIGYMAVLGLLVAVILLPEQRDA